MHGKTVFYILTFTGLYLELAGAFLLSAEAIGKEQLLRIAGVLRRHRVTGFIFFVVFVLAVLLLERLVPALRLFEAFALILTLGLVFDFGARVIEKIVAKLERGTAGMLGFILFAIGFSLQAYVSLTLLH